MKVTQMIEVNKLCELVALHICHSEQLEQENTSLRAEVERLKEENSHLWVRVESGEAAAYEQGKAEARKQTALEIEAHLLNQPWTIPYHETEAMIDRDDAIYWLRETYGLEG